MRNTTSREDTCPPRPCHSVGCVGGKNLVGSGGCEAGCPNKLLGCATSRPPDHSETTVMHGLIGERGGVGAFGGWRGSGGRGGGSGEVVIEAVCVR